MVDDASCVETVLEVDDDNEGVTKAVAPVDARSNREVAIEPTIFMMNTTMKERWCVIKPVFLADGVRFYDTSRNGG